LHYKIKILCVWLLIIFSAKSLFCLSQEIKVLTKLIKKNPDNIQYRFKLAKIYLQKNLINKASKEFERIISIVPDDPVIYLKIARYYKKFGYLKKAILELKTAIKLYKSYPPLFDALGTILLENNQPNTAITYFKKAIKISRKQQQFSPIFNNNLLYKIHLGEAYLKLKKFSVAQLEFEKILTTLTPKDIENQYLTRVNLAIAYIGLKKYKIALEELENLLALKISQKKKANVYFYKGKIYESKGLIDDAISNYKKAIKLNSGFDKAYYKIIKLLISKNSITQAKAFLNKALKVLSVSKNLLELKGLIFLKKEQYNEALKIFNKIQKLDPAYPDISKLKLKAKLGVLREKARKEWKHLNNTPLVKTQTKKVSSKKTKSFPTRKKPESAEYELFIWISCFFILSILIIGIVIYFKKKNTGSKPKKSKIKPQKHIQVPQPELIIPEHKPQTRSKKSPAMKWQNLVPQLKQRVNDLKEQNDIDSAIDTINDFFRKHTQASSDESLLNLLLSLYQERNLYKESIQTLRKLINLTSKIEYYDELGKLYLTLNNLKQATNCYISIMAIEPGLKKIHIKLRTIAKKYYQSNRPLKAVGVLKKILEYYPINLPVLLELGDIYFSIGEIDEAHNIFLKALKLAHRFEKDFAKAEEIKPKLTLIKQKILERDIQELLYLLENWQNAELIDFSVIINGKNVKVKCSKNFRGYLRTIKSNENAHVLKNKIHYLLGKYYFETEDYDNSISYMQKLEKNIDLCLYLESQVYQCICFNKKGLKASTENIFKNIDFDIVDSPVEKLKLMYKTGKFLEEQEMLLFASRLYQKILSINYEYEDVAKRVEYIERSLKQKKGLHDSILTKRYKIKKELGRGGMGVVYLAYDTVQKWYVAIKMLSKELTENKEAIERFEREAKIAANIKHHNIVSTYDINLNTASPYIVMEYVEGINLKDLIRSNGSIPQEKMVEYSIQICQAFDFAHSKGLIHRDIKPDNILIDKFDEVKILDFGLAKIESVSTLTKSGEILGTALYMAPEQIQGKECTFLSDIYSLGITFYEMLKGEPPFCKGDVAYFHLHEEPPQLSSFLPEILPELENLIMKCLKKEPQRRIQSVKELLETFENISLTLAKKSLNKSQVLYEQ